MYIDKIHLCLLSSRPGSPTALSLSSYDRCSSPSHLSVPFTGLASVCPCLSRTGQAVCVSVRWAVHTPRASAALSRGHGSPPSTCWYCSSYSRPRCSTRTSGSFSTELLSSQLTSSTHWCVGLVLPRCRMHSTRGMLKTDIENSTLDEAYQNYILES